MPSIRSGSSGALWAYAYLIIPPFPGHRLVAVRLMLKQEHVVAGKERRVWSGRLVLEPRITQILIVSSTPGHDLPINRRLEEELNHINAHFALTIPIAVGGDMDGMMVPDAPDQLLH